MSLYADIQREFDEHIMCSEFVEDWEMDWEGDVNTMPKTVNARVWLKKPLEFNVLATSKLANIQIADEDYHDGNKYLFTFEEALKIEESLKGMGWRLPTRSEWVLLCEEFGQEASEITSGILCDKLKLKKRGHYNYISDSLYGEGSVGRYWSRTAYSGTDAYYLYFDSSNVGPQDYDYRGYGFALRLVRDLKS